MKTVLPVSLSELADLRPLTSAIQDAKRAALRGKASRWPSEMTAEFAVLEARAETNPYVALDLAYLRDPALANRSFAYVVTYDTFIAPTRDASGRPVGEPKLLALLKLGDGGREEGRSGGAASGSIISRTVRSYWDDPNTYSAVLHGVVIPGDDTAISRKISRELGGSELQVRGDLWRGELLDQLSVERLLTLMEPPSRK